MTEIPMPPVPENPATEALHATMRAAIDAYVGEALPGVITDLRRMADRIEELLPHLPRHDAACESDGCGLSMLNDEFAGMATAAAVNLFTLRGWAEWVTHERHAQVAHLRHIAGQN